MSIAAFGLPLLTVCSLKSCSKVASIKIWWMISVSCLISAMEALFYHKHKIAHCKFQQF